MNILSDYQIRQLLLLEKIIIRYHDNNVVFINLINQIEALIDLLEDIDQVWYEQIKSLWFELEVIYAMKSANVEDGGTPYFDKKELKDIDTIFTKLQNLIEVKINLIPQNYWDQR